MPNTNDIPLNRYPDGTPSVLRKPTVYTSLYFYRKSDVLTQLTMSFCERFLPPYGDRTVDQMKQSARSIKQNIVEGLKDGQTSFEVEIKLLGIAKGSCGELLEDYQDYLKHRGVQEWAISDKARFEAMHKFCLDYSDDVFYHPYYNQWTDIEMANCAICLCHMVDKSLDSFIKKRDREFVTEGGIRERMTAARLDMRGSQKEIIEQQRQQIQQMQTQIESLQRELAKLKGNL